MEKEEEEEEETEEDTQHFLTTGRGHSSNIVRMPSSNDTSHSRGLDVTCTVVTGTFSAPFWVCSSARWTDWRVSSTIVNFEMMKDSFQLSFLYDLLLRLFQVT